MIAALTVAAAILAHTPIWVWVLYAVLLLLGFQRTRDSTVPLLRVLILPFVVALLAIATLTSAGPAGLPLIPISLVIGSTVGWQLERDGATRRLADGRVWLRGEWWSLSQLVMVLIIRYTTGIVAAMDPALNADPTWHTSILCVSAALSGMFLGRTAARLRVYFATGPAAAA